jgi:DNA-binding MarR family transcriptional regulator
VFQDFIQTLRPMKVRPAQYSVLLVIEANPGRSQAAIAQTLSIERARLARLLHVLERRKWIARRASASDARSHSLYLTKDGEKALAQIKKSCQTTRGAAGRSSSDRDGGSSFSICCASSADQRSLHFVDVEAARRAALFVPLATARIRLSQSTAGAAVSNRITVRK